MSKLTYFESYNEVKLTDEENNIIFHFQCEEILLQSFQIKLLTSELKRIQSIANETKPRRIVIKNLSSSLEKYERDIHEANLLFSKICNHIDECKRILKKYDNTESHHFINFSDYNELDKKQIELFSELENSAFERCCSFRHKISQVYHDINDIINTKEERVFTI